jgi:hypothetical protein
MLFDLRGKRKRVIQVIYATLAGLMAIGLVGFGIGSDASGGLFTCNDPQQSANEDLAKRADELQAQLRQSPKDEGLWLELVRARVQAGNSESEQNPQTGQLTYSEDGIRQLEKASTAWDSYLKLKPKNPEPGVAILIAQSDFALAQGRTDLNLAVADLEAAAEAQRIFAEARPSQGTLAQLAQYQYLSGNFKAADRSAKRALADADQSQRSALKDQFEQYEKIGKQLDKELKRLAKAQKQQPGGANPLENPLGGLGSSSGGTAP